MSVDDSRAALEWNMGIYMSYTHSKAVGHTGGHEEVPFSLVGTT